MTEQSKNKISRNRKGMRKSLLVYTVVIFLLLAFIVIKITTSSKESSVKPPSDKIVHDSKGKDGNDNNGFGARLNSGRKPPLVKVHLLKRKDASPELDFGKPGRNIFIGTITAKKKGALPKKEKKKESLPEKVLPPANLKFIGAMTERAPDSQKKFIHYAIISYEGEVFIVKKGDVIAKKYEILNIVEETVEIRDIEFDRVEVLNLEK